MELESLELFKRLPPELAERCRQEYARARVEVTLSQHGIRSLESARENSASENTSSDADTTERSLPPSRMNRLPDSSPLARSVSLAETAAALAQLGFRFGHSLGEERVTAMHSVLTDAGWTSGELAEAIGAISTDPELARQIGFDRTIGPAVFALAKSHARVMRGRLHDYAAIRQMCDERRRPISEFADPVHVEQTDDAGEAYIVTLWKLK